MALAVFGAILFATKESFPLSYSYIFALYFQARIFDETVVLGDAVKTMIHRQDHPGEDRTRLLETLLKEDTDVSSATSTDVYESLVDKLCHKNVELRVGVHRMSKSFSAVCQILLELFFPKFFSDVNEADFVILDSIDPTTGEFDFEPCLTQSVLV